MPASRSESAAHAGHVFEIESSEICVSAVLGGGLQGCCVALALAERGIDVTLFDRNDQLLSRAAVANEGKIHLGYMYANDPSYSTARMMMQGALAFAPFFARHLGLSAGFDLDFSARGLRGSS